MDSDLLKFAGVIVILLGAGVAAYTVLTVISVFKRKALRSSGLDVAATELDAIRGRLEATEALEGRVAELEERIDFAERLLAQQREPEHLPAGRSPDSRN